MLNGEWRMASGVGNSAFVIRHSPLFGGESIEIDQCGKSIVAIGPTAAGRMVSASACDI
jgi:hypothetical protein